MRLFILINFQNKDKELILVDNREKAKKTRVITRSYGRSNNGEEQNTSESNLTTTQMKKEAQDHLDLEILISNDVNNIIEKRTNKEHSDSSNISPTSASSLTTNPMRKIINNFRTSIINLSLFEKFQLGYLILMFIFFILPIVLGNINLFFDIFDTVYCSEPGDKLKADLQHSFGRTIPIKFLISKAEIFRSDVIAFMKQNPDLKETETQKVLFKMIYNYVEPWRAVANAYEDSSNINTHFFDKAEHFFLLVCSETGLSDKLSYKVTSIFYNIYMEENKFGFKPVLVVKDDINKDIFEQAHFFRTRTNCFNENSNKTNGELLDDFFNKIKSDKYEKQRFKDLYTIARKHTVICKENPLYPRRDWESPALIATTTATTTTATTTAPVPSTSATPATATTATTTATTTAPVPLTTAISLHEDPHTNAFLVWYHTTPPSLRPIVISWFGHYLDPTIATPATSATPATATTAHIQKEAVVSNIDTSSTSANTSTTSANTSNGNEPRRSLLVGRRSPEPLSDHTKKNFGGIGEHYNNFRNSPYFYHITIGTIAVSAVAIGIVIYNYS